MQVRETHLDVNERKASKRAGQKAKEVAKDYLEFCRKYLHFEPFSYQKALIGLYGESQFVAARWCRQSGKSWIASGLLLTDAVNNKDWYIAVVGPSWRQTKSEY